jgi:hypothetical protein
MVVMLPWEFKIATVDANSEDETATQLMVVTPNFKVKIECIFLCMSKSSFTHKAINSEINSIINIYYKILLKNLL